jgi:hypothetical protein
MSALVVDESLMERQVLSIRIGYIIKISSSLGSQERGVVIPLASSIMIESLSWTGFGSF